MRGLVPDQDTIYLVLAGSHAHGTARVDSDLDLRGVAIVPYTVRHSFRESFDQYEGSLTHGLAESIELGAQAKGFSLNSGKVEVTIFDVQKFIRLCVAANPNMLEILFADVEDWLFESPAWRAIHERRALFLSRKVCETYVGYAMAQLKRIKTHRAWLLQPPVRKPARKDFGLPENSTLSSDERNRIEEAIAFKLRSWGLDDLEMPSTTRIAIRGRLEEFWTAVLEGDAGGLEDDLRRKAAGSLGLSRQVTDILERERRYRAAQAHWQSYEKWKRERNPVRAELEARFGYDTKHASHLIRLMRSGLELVEAGELLVKRSDASELKSIRDGAMSYDQVVEEAQRLERQMREALEASPLPVKPDDEAIDGLLVRVLRDFSID